MTISTPIDTARERRFERTARVPHTTHMREFTMPDGRKLLVDRRAIAFLCEAKPEEYGGKEVTIIAFRTQCKPCPVKASYGDFRAWWFGTGNGKDS